MKRIVRIKYKISRLLRYVDNNMAPKNTRCMIYAFHSWRYSDVGFLDARILSGGVLAMLAQRINELTTHRFRTQRWQKTFENSSTAHCLRTNAVSFFASPWFEQFGLAIRVCHLALWSKEMLSQQQCEKITPWSSRWFEEISVALIWLALIWLTLIWLTLIWLTFFVKILTHLAHSQMEQIWPKGTFTHCFTTISTYQPKELPSIYF